MALVNTVYNAVFRRSSTFGLAIVASAFMFERAFDMSADYIWFSINRGKLYDDIKEKYRLIREGEE